MTTPHRISGPIAGPNPAKTSAIDVGSPRERRRKKKWMPPSSTAPRAIEAGGPTYGIERIPPAMKNVTAQAATTSQKFFCRSSQLRCTQAPMSSVTLRAMSSVASASASTAGERMGDVDAALPQPAAAAGELGQAREGPPAGLALLLDLGPSVRAAFRDPPTQELLAGRAVFAVVGSDDLVHGALVRLSFEWGRSPSRCVERRGRAPPTRRCADIST